MAGYPYDVCGRWDGVVCLMLTKLSMSKDVGDNEFKSLVRESRNNLQREEKPIHFQLRWIC